MVERRLGEVEVTLFKTRERPERLSPVIPAITKIHHEDDVVASKTAEDLEAVHDLAVRSPVLEDHLDLDSSVAEPERMREPSLDVVKESREGALLGQARIDGGIRH